MNVYEAHTFPDPHLPFIFHCGTRVTKFEDCPNWHENIEIILFLSGEGYMRYDEQIIPVRQGQIAVINAMGSREEISERIFHVVKDLFVE